MQSDARLGVWLRQVEVSKNISAVHFNPILVHILEFGQQERDIFFEVALFFTFHSQGDVTLCISGVTGVRS